MSSRLNTVNCNDGSDADGSDDGDKRIDNTVIMLCVFRLRDACLKTIEAFCPTQRR